MKTYRPVIAGPDQGVSVAHSRVFAPLVFRRWQHRNAVHLGLPGAGRRDDADLAQLQPAAAAAHDPAAGGSGAAPDSAAPAGLRGLQAWHLAMVKAGRIQHCTDDDPIGGGRRS